MKVSCIIAAGGRGERFGKERPKQFQYFKGRPVIAWSIRAFLDVPFIKEMVLVVPDGWEDEAERIARESIENIPFKIVKGGASRAQSVYNGLREVAEGHEWVAVHDAARPGIRPSQIEAALLLARDIGASCVATSCVDTVKLVDSSRLIVKTMPRDQVYLAQTPQVARRVDLLKAFEKDDSALIHATDEATLLESIGVPVGVVDGGINNLKITRPEDLKFLEQIL